MRRLLSALPILLLVACGSNPTSEEPSEPDPITVEGTWNLERINDSNVGTTFDQVHCSGYNFGSDSTVLASESGRLRLFPNDSVRLHLSFTIRCDGSEVSFQMSNYGTYTSREDSLLFSWRGPAPFPVLDDTDWHQPYTSITTTGEVRYPVDSLTWDTASVDVNFQS